MKQASPLSAKTVFLTEPSEIAEKAISMLELNGYRVLKTIQNNNKRDIQGLFIRTNTQLSSNYLSQFPNLEFVLRAGVGTDNIDLDECKSRNIAVFNAPGSNANAVAEYVVLATLLLLRRIPQQVKLAQAGQRRDQVFTGQELKGKVVGLIGCGAIGKAIAKKIKPFEVNLLGFDPNIDSRTLEKNSIKKISLTDLLQKADIVTIQVPLIPATKELINKDALEKMKKSGFLINVSRGEVINEQDLLWALKNRMIAGAVLDVVRDEPSISSEFTNLSNLIITPHVAAFTEEANVQMSVGAVNNLFSWKGIL